MPSWLYDTGNGWVFLLVTVVLGGAAAFMSGRAVAQTWRPYWHIPLYMVPIAATVRFFHYALFAGAAAVAAELPGGLRRGAGSRPRWASDCCARTRWRNNITGCSAATDCWAGARWARAELVAPVRPWRIADAREVSREAIEAHRCGHFFPAQRHPTLASGARAGSRGSRGDRRGRHRPSGGATGTRMHRQRSRPEPGPAGARQTMPRADVGLHRQ